MIRFCCGVAHSSPRGKNVRPEFSNIFSQKKPFFTMISSILVSNAGRSCSASFRKTKIIPTASVLVRTVMHDHSFKVKKRPLPSVEEMGHASSLCEFAGLNDITATKKLLESGANVNSTDYDFRTPLHIAAAAGNVDVVKFLLDNGAVNIFDRFGGLPIHDAQRGNHQKCTDILKTQSTSLDSMFEQGLGMDKQVQKVFDLVVNEGVFSFSLVLGEIDDFYNRMGLDPIYFDLFTPTQIAKHIHSFIAAKKVGVISQTPENLRVEMVNENSYVAIFTDENHRSVENSISRFCEASPDAFHTTFMRSKEPAINEKGMTQHLCIYHVQRTKYENPVPSGPGSDDIYVTASSDYLKTKPEHVIEENALLMNEAMQQPFPVIKITDVPGSETQKNLRIAHRTERNGNTGEHELFIQEVHEIHKRLGITDTITKKYVDSFSNGLTIYSIFFDCADEKMMEKIKSYSSLAFLLPETTMSPLLFSGELSGQEYLYFHAMARFAYYFHAEHNENFNELFKLFSNDRVNRDKLLSLEQSLGTESHSLNVLYSVIMRNLPVCKAMFIDMSKKMKGVHEGYEYPDIEKLVGDVRNQLDREILQTMKLFNDSMTSTNLWAGQKAATSYRMDPAAFLGRHRVPEVPYAIYMVLGYDFTGFHVRFRDISRGGVRVILSNEENYERNRSSQFQENYNLAYTQKLKNKDIPESGSKGTCIYVSSVSVSYSISSLTSPLPLSLSFLTHRHYPHETGKEPQGQPRFQAVRGLHHGHLSQGARSGVHYHQQRGDLPWSR
jgi:glutamate dehydrogenase